MCEVYLNTFHREEIVEVLEDEDNSKHFSVNIRFVELFQDDPDLAQILLQDPEKCLSEWDSALLNIQINIEVQFNDKLYSIKRNAHCRIHDLPQSSNLHRSIFPKNNDKDKLLQITEWDI